MKKRRNTTARLKKNPQKNQKWKKRGKEKKIPNRYWIFEQFERFLVFLLKYDLFICDVTYSRVWHDSFTCVTWRIRMCDMTHSYVWHDSCMCAIWLIHMCGMTHSYVWHDSFMMSHVTHMNESYHTYEWVMSHIWISHVTHMNESCRTYE